MSNFLAIATVTATLQRILQSAVQEDVYGARVTTARPDTLEGGSPETGINIYLYLVTPNEPFRNSDIPTRRPKGDVTKRTQAALDFQYLLSFYGNETELEPQRLLGCVIRTLQEGFTITPQMIAETLADPTLGYLAESDLANGMEPIQIQPTEISVENLSKIWSVFFQTPYSLSCTYKATVIFIEGEQPGARALPVRDRRSLVMPYSQVIVDRVVSQRGKLEPILADSTLLILGRQLYDRITLVRIGGVEIAVEAQSSSQIVFPLTLVPPGVLRAGVQSLQVVHPGPRMHVSGPYRGIESNLAAFVLRPTISSISVSNVQDDRNDTRSANVTVEFNLTVNPGQIVVLILNEWSVDSPFTCMFKASARQEEVMELTIPVDKVKAGEYLVRVQVDGAESLLNTDTDPDSPTFNWYISPRITI
ncbi:MAG TPA: DUF4255 domain-containing protein [Cyanobacteria bacterium UBA8553]|nr:DUF4255 domain-containing protein [Cyanobacteria bacterium UBA8553]